MMRASGITALWLLCATTSLGGQARSPAASGNVTNSSGVSRLDDSVRAVSSQLRCPVCQGESIQESPSELAAAMRQVVREQLAAGRSSEQVKAYFVGKYGEWILLQPKATGVNLTVYVMPVVLLVGGAVFILVAVKRWTRSPAESNANSPPPLD